MISRSYLILIVICFAKVSLFAQGIDSMMKIYAEQYPQQKVYVHFDKGVYRSGETIWFKAYIIAGFLPSTRSRSFYAELIDDNGNVIQRKIYPIAEATTAGNFDLPENFPAANLRFRGYTTWMLNFDTAFIYTKEIAVINKTGKTLSKQQEAKKVSIRFFPEGGDLINGLESVVAFKANNQYGMPEDVKGDIKNSKGEVVASLSTIHDGMGIFKVTPDFGETYTAIFTDSEGIIRSSVLPAIKQEGIVLNIFSAGDKKFFVVKRTNGAPENLQNVSLVGHIGQQLVYKAKIPLVKTLLNSGSLAVDKHPSGIIQFTLFDNQWKPVAERIDIINNNEYHINANINPLITNVNKRAKNSFEIEVEDTLLANLSISVTDVDIKPLVNVDNIISRLLLTGDLKGYVHNPAYYFTNDTAFKNIGLVMLTNGWRRYNWEEVVSKQRPVIRFPDSSYTSLNATVFGSSAASPLRKDESITAILKTRDSSIHVMQIPKTGIDVFSLPNLIFFDTLSVHYQFTSNRRLDKKLTVKFDNGLYKGLQKIDVSNPPTFVFPSLDSSVKRAVYFNDQILKFGNSWAGKGNILETVVVKTKPKSLIDELDKKYTAGMFAGGDAYQFDLLKENLPFNDIFTFIQSRVPGLKIYRGSMGTLNAIWRNSPTQFFLDEMQADPQLIASLSAQDVAYIKVFRPPFFGAFGGGAGGAIAIYTRKGGDMRYAPGAGLAFNTIAGYNSFKEFYSPDYSTRSASADVAADYRTTLYWNPYILTDASKQNVKIEFYNNDISNAFRVILEGVDEEGKLVRVEKIIR